MDEATQQNAALVEEAAAAAESLQDQAGKLAEAVSVFKLESGAYSVRSELPVLRDLDETSQISRTVIAAPGKTKDKPRLALVGRSEKRAGGMG
jgi:hypothetical protein